MSFNGSGTFLINTAGQPVVSGTVISSTAFNALTADLATGLSTAITKDGQTTVTANIPMSTYKFTGLGVGSAATDSANLSQVQSTVTKLLNSVSGADTITATASPTLAAYAAGQMFYFVAAGDNTTSVTLNIDSLGAKAVTRDGSVALAAADIKSGEVIVVVYDGTRFQVVSQLNSAGDARFANVSIASSLYVGGVSTFVGNAGFSANVSIASALSVGGVAAITGATTIGGNLTLSGGTANGVLYLNGSKVATSGSALTFDGSNALGFGTGGTGSTAAVLTLKGSSATNYGAAITGTRNGSGSWFIGDSGTALGGGATGFIYYNYTSGDPWIWYDGGASTERMRLTSTGLGIGTASPGSKLDVRGANSNNLSDLGAQIVNAIDTTAYAQNNGGGIGFGYVFNSGGSVIGRAAVIKAVKENATDGNYATSLVFANAANSSNTIEKMRLNSSGNLGIGVTPNAWSSGWSAVQIGNWGNIGSENSTTGDFTLLQNAYGSAATAYTYRQTSGASRYTQNGGVHSWFNAPSGTAGNAISFTQAMTLTAAGDLGVGLTTPVSTAVSAGSITANGVLAVKSYLSSNQSDVGIIEYNSGKMALRAYGATAGTGYIAFNTGGGGGSSDTERARITSGGNFEIGTQAGTGTRTLTVQTNTSGDPTLALTAAGADGGSFWFERSTLRLYARSSNTGGVYLASGGTSWTAVSDERKKDIIEPITNAAEKVASLRAVVGKYKTDKDGVRRSFLIAQDVQAVFPEAIDASDENELGLSYTDTIPLLVAAIKEQQAVINELKAKVTALESK